MVKIYTKLMRASVLISSAEKMVNPECPVVLVHGAFGAGKSFLTAVLILFYYRAVKEKLVDHPQFRVLVSSNTNVAVDRVLQGLLKLDFHDFVRVGCLKKIARSVLPYTAQQIKSSNDGVIQDALFDLHCRYQGAESDSQGWEFV